MTKAIRARFLLGAALSTLPIAGAAAPAHAQDEAAAAAGESREKIVVTARRREESLQDVPIAVSAFSGDLLEQQGVADITGVAQQTPNVTLEVSRGTNSTLTAFIRGVGQQDPVAGFEAGVGIYIDDVYLNRPQAAVLDIYDVERIEVLRGPQGTLYGKNTIGGAVKYVTRRLADEPEFRARASYGSYNQIDAVASGSVPLGEMFKVGGAFARLTRDGYGENIITGEENYNKDLWALRGSAELQAAPNFALRLSGDYTKDESNARQGHRFITSLLTGAPVLDDVFDTRAGLDFPEQEVTAWGAQLAADWDLNSEWRLRSITAYRTDESTTPIDFDSLPAADLDVPAIYENEQLSQELQLLYEGDFASGVIGAYYLDANAVTAFDVLLFNTGALLNLPGLTAQTFGDVDTKTWSVFADFTFDLTEQLSFSIGGRYTSDERSSIVRRTSFINGPSDFFGGDATAIAVTSNFAGSEEFTDFSPRLSLSWKPNADNNLYISYSKGFKGGGFDPRGQTSAARDFDGDGDIGADDIFEFMKFDPERVASYEAGWKTSQLNGRLSSNLAVFFADYEDVQVPGSAGFDSNNDGINDTFIGITSNAGAAEFKGVEWEGYANFAENLFTGGDSAGLTWAVGYLDAKYTEFVNALGVDVADTAVIQNTPDWTAGATLTYSVPVGRGDLSVINALSYRGDSSQFEFANAFLDQPAYSLWNASLVWDSDDGRWRVGLHGKNLTDEEYVVAGYNFVNANANGTFTPTLGLEGTLTGFYGDPRTVTATVEFRY